MKLKIGTRKSKLAMAQTFIAVNEITRKFPEIETEIVQITTKGDRVLDKPLSYFDGKGVFVGEIESALQEGDIDIAVHSAKDLPLSLGNNLKISAVLKRGDPRDVLITRADFEYNSQSRLNIGTGSLRRRVSFARLYKNAIFSDIRGNVDTRLNKLLLGEYDGIILAAAGLERLGITQGNRYKFEFFGISEFLPAPCQGIIALECKKDSYAAKIAGEISHKPTQICFEAERFVSVNIGGSCMTPLGAYSEIVGDTLTMSISKDPNKIITGSGNINKPTDLARELISKL